MKKYPSHIFILIALLAVFLASTDLAHAQTTANGVASAVGSVIGTGFDLVGTVLSPLGYALMRLVSFITMLAGVALNAAIYYTVIQMAQTFSDVPAIDQAWGVIRDVANMGFIFVLLYAAIKLILGIDDKNTKGLIVNMIVAAILINFSLFFTKVVIDVANLLALTLYSTMAPISALGPDNFLNAGISNSMMDALRITTLWENRSLLTGSSLFITTILSSVVLLIAAFVFFAVALMFIIRYVVLIFVLILSPIAFVSSVLPGLSGPAKKWKDALFNQAFFAPIYFLLTWVTILVARGLTEKTFISTQGLGDAFSSGASGAIPVLINFAVVIIFLIVSLVVSKSMADKAGFGIDKATKWATGMAGGATLGLAGRFGRNVIGARAAGMANDEDLKRRALENKGISGKLARLQFATATKAAKSSFDIRATALGGAAGIKDTAQKDGFIQDQKDRAKFYERFKPSEVAKRAATTELEQAERKADTIKKPPELIVAEKEIRDAEEELARAQNQDAERVAKERLDRARAAAKPKQDEYQKKREEITRPARETKEELDNRMENKAKQAEKPIIKFGKFELSGTNISGKDRASAIRAAAKGKSPKEKLADAAAEAAKAEKEEAGEKEEKKEEKKPETPPAPAGGPTPAPAT